MKNNAEKIYNLVGAEAVFTEAEDLRKYLTGFSSTFGYVLTDKNGTIFYTDPRYIEGATNALKNTGITVKVLEGAATKLLSQYKEVAIPIEKTLHNDFMKLSETGIKIVDSSKAFTSAMSVKESFEIDYIKEACIIADKSYLAVLDRIKEGMTENDLAAELEYLMRLNGASGASFETIIGFEENSSVPHHETGMRKLKYGDIILMDFGCKYSGYCSDCTRTILFGDDKNHGEFKDAYAKVLEAHMIAKEKITDKTTGKEADAFARDCLEKYGLAKYFTHSLGHGIGINIHEFPRLSIKSNDILLNGMVFSDEPGVYLEGKFGIRIEDSVMLENGKVVSLTNTDKKLTIL